MKLFKSALLSALLISCVGQQAHTISREDAEFCGFLVGAAAMTVSAVATHRALSDSDSFLLKAVAIYLASCATYAITSAAFSNFLMQFTPEGRFDATSRLVAAVNADEVAASSQNIPGKQEHINSLVDTLRAAHAELNEAYEEVLAKNYAPADVKALTSLKLELLNLINRLASQEKGSIQ